MKGVILAGGLGTRLRPATNVINKHLLNVYNKPMIYYPIKTLVDGGITEIMIITGEEHAGMFVELLKDGKDLGCSLTYGFQHGAGGIAEALKIARKWVGDDMVAVILGDNFFEDKFVFKAVDKPTIFTKLVSDAKRFGVYDPNTAMIKEKPDISGLARAVTGLYVYDGRDLKWLDSLSPSARGELEITDFNNFLLDRHRCEEGEFEKVCEIEDLKGFWSDMGTPESLLRTANFIAEHA